MLKRLTEVEIRTPQFHILPKIHKRKIPGKLAVSLAVDHYLKPHVEALPSYINDTADFININKINEA